MKRVSVALLSCAAAGATANLAVAWGSAYLRRPLSTVYDKDESRRLTNGQMWFIQRFRDRRVTIYLNQLNTLGSRGSWPEEEPDPRDLSPGWLDLGLPDQLSQSDWLAGKRGLLEYRAILASGWPCRSLWCELNSLTQHGPDVRTVDGGIRWGLELKSVGQNEFDRRALPYRIIWLGSSINTLAYGALIGLMLFGPRQLRRAIRRRRGRCIECGYPLGKSRRCTECGHAPRDESSRSVDMAVAVTRRVSTVGRSAILRFRHALPFGLMFLVAGAITSLAVAVYCAAKSQLSHDSLATSAVAQCGGGFS